MPTGVRTHSPSTHQHRGIGPPSLGSPARALCQRALTPTSQAAAHSPGRPGLGLEEALTRPFQHGKKQIGPQGLKGSCAQALDQSLGTPARVAKLDWIPLNRVEDTTTPPATTVPAQAALGPQAPLLAPHIHGPP